MAADPEAYQSALKADRSGEGKLDAAIARFQPAPANPAPMAVVTQAVDLPVRKLPVRSVAYLVPAASRATPPATADTRPVDAALAGLAAAGGVFYWRTRRPSDAQ